MITQTLLQSQQTPHRTPRIVEVYLGLGSNVADRLAMLRFALTRLAGSAGVEVAAVSPLYESAPWGVLDQPAFLNAAARVRTRLAPEQLLDLVKRIEWEAGRRPGRRWGPRPLDIDILFYEGVERCDERLTIPHPRAWQRRFVIEPLASIWSGEPPEGVAWEQRLAEVGDQPVARLAGEWWNSEEVNGGDIGGQG